ncbi:MAG: hypothetical protein HFE04_02005 [Bacilli bacterium]|nr:hypothetical protein [Bacilli bacterium]
MYQNYNYMPRKISYKKDDRIAFAPFVGPFLLGAFTGGAAVAVTNPRPRPYYPPYYGPRPPYFY